MSGTIPGPAFCAPRNYMKAVEKYAGNNLKNTTYSTVGQVINSSNQLVDIGKSSVEAGKNVVNKAGKEANNAIHKANPKNL